MPFLTRPHFEDRQIVQYGEDVINLSGQTRIAPTRLDFSGATTGETAVTINGLTGYLNGERLSGLVVEPAQLRISGSTGTTTQNVTGFVLQSIDPYGSVEWAPISGVSWSVSACTSPLYVSTIEACPNPTDPIYITAGNVQFGAAPSLIADITNTRLGIGTGSPSKALDIQNGDLWVENSDGKFETQLTNVAGPLVRLTGDSTSLTRIAISSPPDGGISIGHRGLTEAGFPGYGKQGDGFLYSSEDENGLNIISQPGTGTDDYIRFYAGDDANGTTPSLYIQGSGSTKGNVGINTETPEEKLHIESGDLLVNNTSGRFYTDIENSSGPVVKMSGASSDLTRYEVNLGGPGSIAMGIRGLTEAGFPGYGKQNDSFLYSSNENNGLNILSTPGTGTDDYIRFYAGQDANGTTPDLYIDGDTVRGNIGINTDSPTEKLHVEGSVRIVDGTEQAGYVLTCDATGTASWQFNSTGFSGNTSGTCITDLYITNLYGCSPVTVHDSLQHVTSSGTGVNSIAWGEGALASGDYSHAQGGSGTDLSAVFHRVTASGDYSYAQGYGVATGIASHAEGGTTGKQIVPTSATTYSAHAEGFGTIASGEASHAEGGSTIASGPSSHAEGVGTLASGTRSHAEGFGTVASGIHSHAEGDLTTASGNTSHAEGKSTVAGGAYSHAEGFGTKAIGSNSHAQNRAFMASGTDSHAEGFETVASGLSSHAEGSGSLASGSASHAEGMSSATGTTAHSEGQNTVAGGDWSHAGGLQSKALGDASYARGVNALAYGDGSNALGGNVIAYGLYSFVGGQSSTSIGDTSFVYSQGSTLDVNNGVILGGTDNKLTGTTSVNSIIVGGDNNILRGETSGSIIGGGTTHTIEGTAQDSAIIGGDFNKIDGNDPKWSSILGGASNIITSNVFNHRASTIIGGVSNVVETSYGSGIVGGNTNKIFESDYSVVIGGQNITGSTDDTVYVPNLTVRNDHILHSDSVLEIEDLPATFEDELKGQVTYFNWSGLTTHTTSNDNPEGRVGFLMGNFSNFPTTKTYGFLTYYNSGHTRGGAPPVGADFYRDKLVLKAASEANGIVINPQDSNPSGILWVEMNGHSVMKLKGDGVSKANLGIAMNPDGTEDATANLQIGGTGTTGTFVYKPSNIPTSSGDTSGSVGEMSWDDDYFYIKTNTGWGRVSLDYGF